MVSQKLTYYVMRILEWVSGALTPRGRHWLGSVAGNVMRLFDSKRMKITLDNLRQAYPDLSSQRHRQIAHGAYNNLGQVLVETLALPSMSAMQLTSCMQISGVEELAQRAIRKEPSILLSGHFGNWEYLAASAGISVKAPITVVAHTMKNQAVYSRLDSYRTTHGNKTISMHHAAKKLIDVMREGGLAAFLVDQFADSNKNPLTTFFGRQTPTYAAPAVLALRYNVPIFYAFAVRTGYGTYKAELLRIDVEGIPNTAEGVKILTQRHVSVLEKAIRANPELWSWQHRRWRPEQTDMPQ